MPNKPWRERGLGCTGWRWCQRPPLTTQQSHPTRPIRNPAESQRERWVRDRNETTNHQQRPAGALQDVLQVWFASSCCYACLQSATREKKSGKSDSAGNDIICKTRKCTKLRFAVCLQSKLWSDKHWTDEMRVLSVPINSNNMAGSKNINKTYKPTNERNKIFLRVINGSLLF